MSGFLAPSVMGDTSRSVQAGLTWRCVSQREGRVNQGLVLKTAWQRVGGGEGGSERSRGKKRRGRKEWRAGNDNSGRSRAWGRGEHTKRCGERVRGKKEERKEVRGDASEWCEACDGAEAKRERAPTQQHAHWDGRRRTDTKGRNSDSQRTRHNILITPRHNCKRVAL